MTQSPTHGDLNMVMLAREIAMDILPLQTILKQYSITDETWSSLQRSTKFKQLLSSEVETWSAALNTHERVKIKSASMLEEWLPALYQRINDPEETLPAVVEAGKMLARLAGIGEKADVSAAIGERFSITINMGPRVETFTKEVTPTPTVIEGTVINEKH